MTASAQSITLEVVENGIVQESLRLGVGRWVLSAAPRVDLTVGEGGCWVEGASSALRVDSKPTARAELMHGALISFGLTTLRAWPSDEPPAARHPFRVTSKPPRRMGLSIELWWKNTFVEKWETNDREVRLPANLFALDGYEPGKRIAMRDGDSYRCFVPNGWEATEPVAAFEATVPTFRRLILSRRGLELRVALCQVAQVGRIRRALRAVAALSATIATVAVTTVPCVDALTQGDLEATKSNVAFFCRFVAPWTPKSTGDPCTHPTSRPHHQLPRQPSLYLSATSGGQEERELASAIITCSRSIGPPTEAEISSLRRLVAGLPVAAEVAATDVSAFERCVQVALRAERLSQTRPHALPIPSRATANSWGD